MVEVIQPDGLLIERMTNENWTKELGNKKMPAVEVEKLLINVQHRLRNLYGWEPLLYNMKRSGDYHVNVTLKPNKDFRPDFFRKVNMDGRKLNAVCFHGHLAWMTEIFTVQKKAHIRSTFASYKDAEDFFQGDKVQETQERNVGSPDEYIPFSEACECSGEIQDFVWGRFHDEADDGF